MKIYKLKEGFEYSLEKQTRWTPTELSLEESIKKFGGSIPLLVTWEEDGLLQLLVMPK